MIFHTLKILRHNYLFYEGFKEVPHFRIIGGKVYKPLELLDKA